MIQRVKPVDCKDKRYLNDSVVGLMVYGRELVQAYDPVIEVLSPLHHQIMSTRRLTNQSTENQTSLLPENEFPQFSFYLSGR